MQYNALKLDGFQAAPRYQQCGLPPRMCIDASLEPPYCLALVFRISPELVI